jgi:hypothetical protein
MFMLCALISIALKEIDIMNTGNSRLSLVMEGRKVMDNPKPRLQQKQSKHGTKWI